MIGLLDSLERQIESDGQNGGQETQKSNKAKTPKHMQTQEQCTYTASFQQKQ